MSRKKAWVNVQLKCFNLFRVFKALKNSTMAMNVKSSGAMALITAGTIPDLTIQFLQERDGSPGTILPSINREQHGTGRCITVQTQRNIVARQLHRISLVPRPQSVDTQPCTESSFAPIPGTIGGSLGQNWVDRGWAPDADSTGEAASGNHGAREYSCSQLEGLAAAS